MDEWPDWLEDLLGGENVPEEQRSPIARFANFLGDKLRELGGERTSVRERLGLPTAVPQDPRMLAQPDALRPPPVQRPDPAPTPLLEAGPRPQTSEQMRRMTGLDTPGPSISSLSTPEALLSTPGVQAARLGIEAALDLSPMGVAKDLTMAGVNLLQGDLGDAAAYGLATIPFVGSAIPRARQAVAPFNRAAFAQQLDNPRLGSLFSGFADPGDWRRLLVFMHPQEFLSLSMPLGDVAIPEALERLKQANFENLVDLPMLGIAPSSPTQRLSLLQQEGIISPRLRNEIERNLAATYARVVREQGLHPHQLQGLGTMAEVVQASGLPPGLKRLLDPANPLMPAAITAHEGRHRNLYAYLMGLTEMPVRLIGHEDLPRSAFGNPLVIRQAPVTSAGLPGTAVSATAPLMDAPTELGRMVRQSEVAQELLRDYGNMDLTSQNMLEWMRQTMPKQHEVSPSAWALEMARQTGPASLAGLYPQVQDAYDVMNLQQYMAGELGRSLDDVALDPIQFMELANQPRRITPRELSNWRDANYLSNFIDNRFAQLLNR